MERYPKEISTLGMFNSMPFGEDSFHQKPAVNRKLAKIKKYAHTNQTLKTLDLQEKTDGKIQFRLEKKQPTKDVPGVGQYDISVPIVKPPYETYDKGNEVVLVKINHIGGTSSFRSEHDRFRDKAQSIYVANQTPGPGSYNANNKKTQKQKNNKPYSESYDIIQEMIMQHRETIESMPNYSLPPKGDYKYNGMPRHLQDMYHKLNRARINAENYRETSLPIGELKKLREQSQKVPIKSVQEASLFVYLDVEQPKPVYSSQKNQRLTETMHRFEQQKMKQSERTYKIKAILQNNKKRSFSVERNPIKKQSDNESEILKQKYNRNMVNILFGQKNTLPKGWITRSKHGI